MLFTLLFFTAFGGLPYLTQVTDISQLISKQDETIQLNKRMESIFGSTRLALVQFKDAFTLEKLKEAKRLANRFEDDPLTVDVVSIYSEKYLSGSDGSFEVESILEEAPKDIAEITALENKLKSFPLYQYSLYQNKNLIYLIQFKPEVSDQQMSEFVNKIITASRFPESLSTSGWPEINNNIKGYMDRDLFVLIPITFLIITLLYYYLFRSWRGVTAPLLTIIIAITVSTGFMSYFGMSLNAISNSIPILLIAIGTSDGIHFLSKYYLYAPDFKDHNKLLAKTTKVIAPTILLTSITTMGGFLANIFSPVKSIQEFGIIMAVGVFIAGLASYILIPAILSRFDILPVMNKDTKLDTYFYKLATKLYHLVAGHKGLISFIVLLFLAANVYLLSSLKANYTLLGYFHSKSKVVKDAQQVAESTGGLVEFNITIDTKRDEGLIDHQLLSTFEEVIEKTKKKYPEDIVYVTGLTDYIKNMSKAYNGGDEYYRIPTDNDEISQYLEVYSWSGDAEEDLKYVTDSNYRTGRIYGRFKVLEDKKGKLQERNIRYYETIVKDMMQELRTKTNSAYDIQMYGELPMWITTLYNIVEGQIVSVLMAILVVFVLALPILRSLSLTFISLIPVTLAISFNFAFMSLTGIQLDIATSLVSAMAIGIGIDDALHFLLTYKRLSKEENEGLEATLLKTMQVTGKAIFATSITLVLGYSVFFFSSFKPIVNFGLLNILIIFMATVATFTVIPLAILIFTPLQSSGERS